MENGYYVLHNIRRRNIVTRKQMSGDRRTMTRFARRQQTSLLRSYRISGAVCHPSVKYLRCKNTSDPDRVSTCTHHIPAVQSGRRPRLSAICERRASDWTRSGSSVCSAGGASSGGALAAVGLLIATGPSPLQGWSNGP